MLQVSTYIVLSVQKKKEKKTILNFIGKRFFNFVTIVRSAAAHLYIMTRLKVENIAITGEKKKIITNLVS